MDDDRAGRDRCAADAGVPPTLVRALFGQLVDLSAVIELEDWAASDTDSCT